MWKRKQRFKVKVNSSHCAGKYVKSIERINSEIFKTNFKGIGNYRQYPVGEPHIHCCPSVFWHQYTLHTTLLLLLLLYCMWSQVPIRVFPLYYYGSSVLLSLMEFQAVNPMGWIVLSRSCFRVEVVSEPKLFWAVVFQGRSRHWDKVFSGQKYRPGRSMHRAKLSVSLQKDAIGVDFDTKSTLTLSNMIF